MITYLVSLGVNRDDFETYFLFTKDTRNLLQPFRAILASNDFGNMLMSGPLMLLGGYLLQGVLGSDKALKFFQVSLFACFVSLWLFGPKSDFFDWNLREYFPYRCDGIVVEKQGLMAPDLMAACCINVLLSLHEKHLVLTLMIVADLVYFGPLALAMPFSLLWFFKMRKQ